jgi:hypothetical protein
MRQFLLLPYYFFSQDMKNSSNIPYTGPGVKKLKGQYYDSKTILKLGTEFLLLQQLLTYKHD